MSTIMRSNIRSNAVLRGLQQGRLVPLTLHIGVGDVRHVPPGAVVLVPPEVAREQEAILDDTVRAPSRPLVPRQVWQRSLNVRSEADLRVFRQASRLRVMLEDVRQFWIFCRQHRDQLKRPPEEQLARRLEQRAKWPRAGRLYACLLEDLRGAGPPPRLGECAYCGELFASLGRVRACCPRPICRRKREAERVRRRYWSSRAARAQAKERVRRWRSRTRSR